MTTTQPTPIDYSKGPARIDPQSASHATPRRSTSWSRRGRITFSSCGVALFWRYLTVKGTAIVAGGSEIHLKRGPVTKVDQTTLTLLRADALTHQRCTDAEI